MKKITIFFFIVGLCVSCGGPKLFKKPQDFVAGNRAAAVALHCHRKGETKTEVAYKLCQESFKTHYSR